MSPGARLEQRQIDRFRALIGAVRAHAADIAVTIVADDAADADDKPALKQVHFLERLDAEMELNRVTRIFLDAGIACRVIFGFRKFMELALEESLFPAAALIKVVVDRTEGGGHRDGFGPARRSTGALLCRQFGFHYAHSDAYSAAITRHKHHQAIILRSSGLPVPNTWSFDSHRGWIAGEPAAGFKIICKSTFEAWSIGVSEETVGEYDGRMRGAIRDLAEEIGQPVCVQQYIEGREIYSLVVEDEAPSVVGLAEARSSAGPKSNGSYLAFDDHHRPGGIVYDHVADLAAATALEIERAAIGTFLLLSMSVVGRIDFRVDGTGRPFIIDIADNPGTSRASSLVFILSAAGFSLEEIPVLLLGLSLARTGFIASVD
ncbi:hypothetical protein A6U97_27670 [Agrobacterium tumefaciens]|uniref:hypothetical protein n=1 Tax=Agrobacterium tumefaciens TaxID=358 RepID=UPI00080FCFB8|nr:hypothetical protein A6U97_27670 [Agrobacterium tumefaciens]